MLLLTLPITAYTFHASTRPCTRPSRFSWCKMAQTPQPAPAAQPPSDATVDQHRRIDYVGHSLQMSSTTVEIGAKSSGTANEALEAIFRLHAEGTVLKPGTAMFKASQDLAKTYPALLGLGNDALVGRLFQFLDKSGDGVLEVHEWVNGISAVLNKSTPEASALTDRIAQANAAHDVHDFSQVKKVGVIGAGVAGLQAANELRKAGFEVKIFEKSAGVAGVWRTNYADFGLQVPREASWHVDKQVHSARGPLMRPCGIKPAVLCL